MARVIGVRFRDNGKIYYFASEQFEVEVGPVSYTHLDVYKRQERRPLRKAKYYSVTDSV